MDGVGQDARTYAAQQRGSLHGMAAAAVACKGVVHTVMPPQACRATTWAAGAAYARACKCKQAREHAAHYERKP